MISFLFYKILSESGAVNVQDCNIARCFGVEESVLVDEHLFVKATNAACNIEWVNPNISSISIFSIIIIIILIIKRKICCG